MPNKVFFSLASTFVFLAYAEYGPAAGFLVQAAEAVVSSLNVRAMVRKSFNFGQLLISLLAFHLIYQALGSNSSPLTVTGAFIALLSGLVYFCVNLGLVVVVIHLASGGPVTVVAADLLRDGYMGIVGNVGLFIPLCYLFRQGGWPTLLLFCGGLLAFRHAVKLLLDQKRIHLDSLGQLARLVERKTGAMESHAMRVASMARSVAESLKLPADQVDTIYAAGILHDVGEAEVDPRIVSVMARKAIPTLADLEAYRKHPELGQALVGKMEGMAAVAMLIRNHHEAWDGSGYPDGLRGEAIPPGARILAAAELAETVMGDLQTRLSAIESLGRSQIDPRLVTPIQAALRKADKQPISAEAVEQPMREKVLPSELLQAVNGSRFLEKMGVGRIYSYRDGQFTNLMGSSVTPPEELEIRRLAQQCVRSQLAVRQHVAHGGKAHDVYCIPAGSDSATLLLFDVTHAVEMERDQLRRIFRAYRDTMSVATRGKLLLMDDHERDAILVEGQCQGEVHLAALPDGPTARALVSEIAERCGLSKSEGFHLTVCASEAITNVFKHAGKGLVSVRAHADTLRVIVTDYGDGIPYDILPRAVLVEGYSTKHSLGKGFTVMLRFLDRVLLHTSSEGTVIVLEKRVGGRRGPIDSVAGAGAKVEG